MHLRRLHVHAAPGLDEGLPELELPLGLTLVVGPNGSGKSTLARAVRAILWAEAGETRGLRVSSQWQCGDVLHRADLFAGSLRWDPPLAAPTPAGAAGLARLGIRSLLAEDGDADQELARRLLRELSGGLDLRAAQATFATPQRLSASRGLAQALKQARADYQAALGATDALAQREQERSVLDARIAEVEGAARRHRMWILLGERLQADVALGEADETRASFEAGLDELREDDADTVADLQRELEGVREAHEGAQSRRRQHEATLDAQAFASTAGDGSAEPSPVELDAWAGRLDPLAHTERGLAPGEAQLAGARQRRDLAWARVQGASNAHAEQSEAERTEAGSGPAPEALDALAEGLERVRSKQAAVESARAGLEAWERWARDGAADDEDDAGRLRRAVDDLRSWMRLAEPGPGGQGAGPAVPTPLPRWLALVLIAVGVLALLLAVVLDQPWLSVMTVLAGVGGGLLWAARPGLGAPVADGAADAEAERVHLRKRLEQAGQAPPDWQEGSVSRHLDALEDRLAERQAAMQGLERAEARRAQAEAQLRKAEQLRQEAHDQLMLRAAEAGLAVDFVELSAVAQAQALARWLDAQGECVEREASLGEAREQVRTGLERFAAWLHGFGVEETPADVPAAQALRRRIEERCRAVSDARKGIEDARREEDEARRRREETERKLEECWRRVGVPAGDLAGLERRLGLLPAWREARDLRSAAESARRIADQRLRRALDEVGEDPELAGIDLEGLSAAQVEDLAQQTRQQADERDSLLEQRTRLQADLERAAQGHGLADALAALREAERAVADERERAVEDALARQLLEEAQASHEASYTPPVLRRAQALLARFTHHAWRLEVGEAGRFHAVEESSGQARSLGELSDGTRTQLLLAARLAALEQLEADGDPVPLCLDEALANSDPRRFRAVAEALLELADEGRQVLYFTADPGEAEQWAQLCRDQGRPEPARRDLAALRGEPADWGGALPAVPEPAPAAPDPTGLTPAQYAERIGAPRPAGHQPVERWHLYTVAYDQLPALAACLDRLLVRVGQWRSARRAGGLPPEVDEDTVASFDARDQLATALAERWRQGRGRPLTWDDVGPSGAITAAFEDRVKEILQQRAHDPRSFVEEVEALPRFRDVNRKLLREHLEAAGCLPTNDALPTEELARRALADAPQAVEVLGALEAAAHLNWLLGLLGAEAEGAAEEAAG